MYRQIDHNHVLTGKLYSLCACPLVRISLNTQIESIMMWLILTKILKSPPITMSQHVQVLIRVIQALIVSMLCTMLCCPVLSRRVNKKISPYVLPALPIVISSLNRRLFKGQDIVRPHVFYLSQCCPFRVI